MHYLVLSDSFHSSIQCKDLRPFIIIYVLQLLFFFFNIVGVTLFHLKEETFGGRMGVREGKERARDLLLIYTF